MCRFDCNIKQRMDRWSLLLIHIHREVYKTEVMFLIHLQYIYTSEN